MLECLGDMDEKHIFRRQERKYQLDVFRVIHIKSVLAAQYILNWVLPHGFCQRNNEIRDIGLIGVIKVDLIDHFQFLPYSLLWTVSFQHIEVLVNKYNDF